MGRRDVHRDEDGSLRADYSGPAADPAACYIHMIVDTYSYIVVHKYILVDPQ